MQRKGKNMKTDISIVKRALLFQGMTEEEIVAMLNCLRARSASYDKNSFIFRRGDSVSSIGLVTKGSINIIEEDFWGNRSILSNVGPGNIFAESYACVQNKSLRVSVQAAEPTSVLFLDIGKVVATCSSACEFHTRLVKNLLVVLAQKNLNVTEKLGHVTKRTTREKIMSYLSSESQKNNTMEFDIPFNRQEFADFLSVDRSALSKELARMSDEGVLEFKKNHFVLK
jgi:CRP-like cAMP-binding protein